MKRPDKIQFLKDHPERIETLFFPIFRNVHIFLSFYGLEEKLDKEQLAKKYDLGITRIEQIIKKIWHYVDQPNNSKYFKGED